MSEKDLSRYDIIRRLIRKEINGTEAADLLCLSTRQVRRLKAIVIKHGPKGLIHGNRGRTSNRRIPEKERQRIIHLLHKHYPDFGPTFATEKLQEVHNLHRDPTTVRQIMIDEKLWKPKSKRKNQEHRTWRQRKACYGEMIQFDGSYEYWFEDRADKCCLLAAIDDATGKVVKARFVKDEGVFSVFNFWREYIQEHGKPFSVYLDKFSTYKMNPKAAEENHELKTQFQRAMAELRIEPIFANSPQAKGRVERLFNTLQDRLIKELRLKNISNPEHGNEFLEKTYLSKFNKQFTVEARNNKVNLHKQLTVKDQKQLNSIFSKQKEGTVQNDFTLSFEKQWYQLIKDQPVTVCKKDKVIVEKHLDQTVHIRLRGKYLNYQVLPEWAKKPRGRKPKMWILPATAKGIGKLAEQITNNLTQTKQQARV